MVDKVGSNKTSNFADVMKNEPQKINKLKSNRKDKKSKYYINSIYI